MKDGILKIAKNMFYGGKVIGGRMMHELREFANDKGDVRTSERKILEGTHDLAMLTSIYRRGTFIEAK